MTIGELAARSGMAASAIRYYESSGLLPPTARVNGRRVYEPSALHQLAIIGFAKSTGFTLPEIKLLLRGFPLSTPASARWKKMAERKIDELESTVARVQAMKQLLRAVMSCQCLSLAQCAGYLERDPQKWQLPSLKKQPVVGSRH